MWLRNLRRRLQYRSVLIVHGNVRDRYIDDDGRVYENLTALLTALSGEIGLDFGERTFYDPVAGLREANGGSSPSRRQVPPTRILAAWNADLRLASPGRFVVLFYLDKLVAEKASYSHEEQEILLWLEKVIENIQPNHRLVLVALQDSMIPRELYTSSPKTEVVGIPLPGRGERRLYLQHRLGHAASHLDLLANLADGLYLRDLDNIADSVAASPDVLTERDVLRLVNKYRIGEAEDHWGQLSIESLDQKAALDWFSEREGVKGQDEAIGKVIDMLCLARAGMSGLASGKYSKPKGVLFFTGPTGVGKTFLAVKLAKFLFGTEEAFLRIDMSEMKEAHTVSKLIGSPPGYVGFEEGGLLTNAVRARPFSVILFDEIEKAHPLILDIFLQILDDGRLTDSRGQTVFFTETAIVFTSNIGTRSHDSRGLPIGEKEALDALRHETASTPEQGMEAIRAHFAGCVEAFFATELSRPELLNRIGTNIVAFNHILTPDRQREVIEAHLSRIVREFDDGHRGRGHRLSIGADVSSWLVERYGGRIGELGGRGITQAINDEILVRLARTVLAAEYTGQRDLTFHVRPVGSDLVVED